MQRQRLGARRVLLLVVLLIGAGLWGWPEAEEPPAPVPVVVAVPPVDGELSCDVSDPEAVGDASGADSGASPERHPPTAWVPCPLPAALEHQPAGALYLDGPPQPLLEEFRYAPDTLWVPLFPEVVAGRLYLDGFSRIDLDLRDGRCVPGPVVAKATLTGLVHHAGSGTVTVQGCGTNGMVDADGGFFVELDAAPCTFFAVRQDGALMVRSTPLALDPQPGEELIVDLHLPAWPATTPGLRLRLEDGAVVVGEVEEGGSAARAGLVPGEEVVAIDGRELTGLDLWALGDRVQGPADSTLTITVAREGGLVELGLVREP